MTLSGKITEFAAEGQQSLVLNPDDEIVAEPDGTLRFTDANTIVRMTPPR